MASPLTITIGLLWVIASAGEIVLLLNPSYVDTFWDHFWFFPILLSFILMLPAFILARLRFREAAGAPGRLGLLLNIAGCTGIWIIGYMNSFLIRVLSVYPRPNPFFGPG